MPETTPTQPASTYGMLLIVAVAAILLRAVWAYAPWPAALLPFGLWVVLALVRGVKKGLSS